MPSSHADIVSNTITLLKQIPFRTKFERENFLYGTHTGPRLLTILCQDIISLNEIYNKSVIDWEKERVLTEMNLINEKIIELMLEFPNISKSLEEEDAAFWVEHLARKAAVEALCQQVSIENMSQMLKLPAEQYEETVTKCQMFLNIINKTTRIAERKANVSNVSTE